MISLVSNVLGTHTFKPWRASRTAATSPLCPAPTIATSAFFASMLKPLNPFCKAFRHAVNAFSRFLDIGGPASLLHSLPKLLNDGAECRYLCRTRWLSQFSLQSILIKVCIVNWRESMTHARHTVPHRSSSSSLESFYTNPFLDHHYETGRMFGNTVSRP